VALAGTAAFVGAVGLHVYLEKPALLICRARLSQASQTHRRCARSRTGRVGEYGEPMNSSLAISAPLAVKRHAPANRVLAKSFWTLLLILCVVQFTSAWIWQPGKDIGMGETNYEMKYARRFTTACGRC